MKSAKEMLSVVFNQQARAIEDKHSGLRALAYAEYQASINKENLKHENNLERLNQERTEEIQELLNKQEKILLELCKNEKVDSHDDGN